MLEKSRWGNSPVALHPPRSYNMVWAACQDLHIPIVEKAPKFIRSDATPYSGWFCLVACVVIAGQYGYIGLKNRLVASNRKAYFDLEGTPYVEIYNSETREKCTKVIAGWRREIELPYCEIARLNFRALERAILRDDETQAMGAKNRIDAHLQTCKRCKLGNVRP